MKNLTAFTKAIVLVGLLPFLSSCSKTDENGNGDSKTGYVSGIALNGAGEPLEGIHIFIDHNIFFNSNINTYTNEEGRYQVKIPTGSWFAFALHEVNFNDKLYKFYLNPDKSSGFGGEGAVRNFVWKLKGKMPAPLSGNFGGLITFDSFPGVYIEEEIIDFELSPVGPLIDGSSGEIIIIRGKDATLFEDVPIGKYILKAQYLGKPLKFRRWNSEERFERELEIQFEPKIDAQCFNCAKIEYFWEP